LSVPGLPASSAAGLAGDGWRVLRASAHGERLRTGELVGNRFHLVVREVDAAAAAAAVERLAEIERHGMPNLFGEQRFGVDGDNAERGARLLRGERVDGGRRLQRLYLSALQSAVFNEVLRTRRAAPHAVLEGDLALVAGSGALLHVGSAALPVVDAARRAERFELSPTGPLLGHKMRAPRGEPLAHEREVARRLGVPWVDALPRLRGHQQPGGRRPLRARVSDVAHRHEDDALALTFVLPPGSYATVLVGELFAVR
jgi:tRNA pseudouridine13 synthase